ncbi:MAG TPA: hypothetical protein VF070_27680 [Streptosporangiaceae bacterium]
MSVTTGRALRGAIAAVIVAVSVTACQQITSPDPAACKAALQAEYLKDKGHLGAEPSVCKGLSKAQVEQYTQQVLEGK